MKYCVNCGNELRENANFCEKCGTKRGEAKQEKKEEGTIRVNVVDPNPPKDNTGKILLIVFGCIGVMFLALIIGGVAFSIYTINKINADINERYELMYEDLEELSVENFRLRYDPTKWVSLEGLNEKEKILIKDDSTIIITKEEVDYSNEYQFEENIIEKYIEDGYEEYGYYDDVYAYDDYFNKLTFTKVNYIEEIVYKIEDNYIYLLKYTGPKSYYNNNSYDLNEIYYTLQIREEVMKD